MRFAKRLLVVAVVLLIVAQFFRIQRDNPPVVGEIDAPAPTKAILRRACYPCHSNEVVWPWYAGVAPMSWMVGYDVHEGRKELNFSEWGTYTPARRAKKLQEITEEITNGEMPPWYFVYPMHPEAKLSPDDRDAIDKWIAAQHAPSHPQPTPGS